MDKPENKSLAVPGDRRDSQLLDLLASALEAAATAVAIVDRDRTVVWANPAVEALTGYTPEEIVGKSTPAYWSSQQSPQFYEGLFRALLAGQKWRGELINRRKDGSFYDEERIITPIRNSSGEVTHFIALGLDISERKRAERDALRLMQMSDQTPNLLAMADLEGKIFFVNRTLVKMLGFTADELAGQHVTALMAGSNPRDMVEAIGSAMFLPGGWTGDVNLRRKDGSEFPIEFDLKPLLDKEGKVTGCFGIARDVAEKRRAAEALRQSYEMFEALFESSPDAMLAVDGDGRIVRVNDQAEKLFGYTRGELLGASVELLIPEHFRLAHPDRNVDAHARTRAEERDLRGRRKDGSNFPVEVSLSLLQTQAGNLVLSAVRDITLRKQADKALKETHERLNNALRNAERQSREAAKLSELVDILQSCPTLQEAYEVAAGTLKVSLPYLAGAVCIVSPSRNVVEAVGSWGEALSTEKTFRPEDCWALRRSRVHQVKDPNSPLRCAHVRGNPPGGYFCVPLLAQGESYGVLYLELPPEAARPAPESAPRERRADAVDIEVRQATALGERLSLAFGNLRLREALRSQSIRDPLTNLYNRRYMEESLEREISRSVRSGQPVALLLLDIDHFKLFNDTYGHQGGDALLRTLGDFLTQRTRGQDVACRYGGEEFAIILSGTTGEKASQRAQILRKDLKHMMVEHSGQIVGSVTISIGIAVAPEHGVTAGELLRAADGALYAAKAEGRDRVVVADPSAAMADAPVTQPSGGSSS